MIEISVRDFTTTPGGRKREDGTFSGEEFREVYLEPIFEDNNNTEVIHLDMDGVFGYSTSFLEEVFGGLARKYGKSKVRDRFVIKIDDEPRLKKRISEFIEKSH